MKNNNKTTGNNFKSKWKHHVPSRSALCKHGCGKAFAAKDTMSLALHEAACLDHQVQRQQQKQVPQSKPAERFECEDCGKDFATFTEAEACEQSCKAAKAPPATATTTVRAGHEPYKPPRKPPALTHRPGYPDLGLPAPLPKPKETAPVTSPATMQPKAAAPVATPAALPKAAETHTEKVRRMNAEDAKKATKPSSTMQLKRAPEEGEWTTVSAPKKEEKTSWASRVNTGVNTGSVFRDGLKAGPGGVIPKGQVPRRTSVGKPPLPTRAPVSAPVSTPAAPLVDDTPELDQAWVAWEHRNFNNRNATKDKVQSMYHNSFAWVGEYKTIGSFWRLFNNLPSPSAFFGTTGPRAQVGGRPVQGWSIFARGVKPEFEDPQNASGGEVRVTCPTLDVCDEWWRNVVMALTRGALSESGVLGARVMDKSNRQKTSTWRLEIWYAHGTDVGTLKTNLAELLHEGMPDDQPLPVVQSGPRRSAPMSAAPPKPSGESKEPARQVDISGAKAILGKLTPTKFDRLAPQFLAAASGADASGVETIAKHIHSVVQDQALFGPMYADLALELEKERGYKGVLAKRCWDEFLSREKRMQTAGEMESQARKEAKHNVLYLTELHKRGLVEDSQILACADELAEGMKNVNTSALDIELLCSLLMQSGASVDAHKARAKTIMDAMEERRQDKSLPARLRFMIQDVVDVRTGVRSKTEKDMPVALQGASKVSAG